MGYVPSCAINDMTVELAPTQFSQIDHTALKQAVQTLENPNFAARLADYAGIPVNRVLGILPKIANNQLGALVRSAVMKSLDVAIDTLEDESPPTPATWFSSFLAGVTGGVSGLFGIAALPVELPLTTTFMLRAIASIARHTASWSSHWPRSFITASAGACQLPKKPWSAAISRACPTTGRPTGPMR